MIQLYLPEAIQIQSTEYNTFALTDKDAQTVYSNSEYTEYISIIYVTDFIKKGISAGSYENDKLVSCAIAQDDEAIAGYCTHSIFTEEKLMNTALNWR